MIKKVNQFKTLTFGVQPRSSLVHAEDYKIYEFLNIEKYNAIIAGGCALSWYQHQPVGLKDIDLWFDTQDHLNEMSRFLSDYSFNRRAFQSANAETWECTADNNKTYRIQLIKNYFYTDIHEVINNFDISVCQIATDGNTWYHSDQFCADLKEKRLRFVKNTPGSLKRLIKYWGYGFQPDDNTLHMIINNSQIKWDFSEETDGDYADAF